MIQSESTANLIKGIKLENLFVSTTLFNQCFEALEQLITNQQTTSHNQKRRQIITPNSCSNRIVDIDKEY